MLTMYWGDIIIGIIFFCILIFSLFFGVKLIIKYWEAKKVLNLIFGIILMEIFVISAVVVTTLLVDFGIPEGCEMIDSECLATNIEITNVVNTTENNYEVTLNATSLYKEKELGGVAVVFTDLGYLNSIYYISNEEYPMDEIMKNVTIPIIFNDSYNVEKVAVVAYFMDSYGNKLLCSTANHYKLS